MSKTINLKTRKYESEGNLSWEYNPLHNIVDKSDISTSEHTHSLKDFDVDTSGELPTLNFNMTHPVEIEVQPSYDGSVNLILNDDHDVPRIINTAFSVEEDWKYKRIVRNQQSQTNYYPEENIDSSTRLFRTTSTFLNVDFTDVESGGVLKGGNYIFFFKYGDEDSNETNWVGETSVISIFHGFSDKISNIKGTLLNESTNHQITLHLTGVDTAFSKLSIFAQRTYSDLNGIKTQEYFKFVNPYEIVSSNMEITITGYEQTVSVSQDIFNIKHNVYDAVATSAQVQNRLFFGNVKEHAPKHNTLATCALNISVKCIQNANDSIGYVNSDYISTSIEGSEYYNPKHIYNRLGYWPNELYRIGVVYIYDNDVLSDAYNLKGCCFSNIGESNFIPGEDTDGSIKKYDLKKIFINDEVKYNTKGVFQMPDIPLLNNSDIYPIGLEMEVPHSVSKELRKLHIKGMFFVRQNRIPIALAQGVSIGISKCAHIPVLSQSTEDGRTSFIAESILSESGNSYILTRNIKQSIIKLRDSESSESEDSEEKKEKDVMWESDVNGLLSQDVNLNKSLQSMLDGSRFVLKPYAKYDLVHSDGNFRYYVTSFGENLLKSSEPILAKLAYIGPNTPSRVLEESYFSSKSGSESELSTLRNLRWSEAKTLEDSKRPIDEYTIRGNYTGYIGVIDGTLEPNTAYTIYNECYIGNNNSRRKIQVELRAQDQSPFLAISQRFGIDTENSVLKTVYRGDCFTCTTSIKMCYNFLDYNTPLNDKIIKANIETENDKKIRDDKNNPKNPFDYNNWQVSDRNLSDWNTVSIGHFVTYKCMSNFNLGLRCIDDQRTDERALFGDIRTFYPWGKYSPGVSFKIPESELLNGGHSSILGPSYFFNPEDVPYIKEFFDNRIAFSGIQSNESFQNNYRLFTGLSYTDIERKFGAIVKLIPLGTNLFCVFEHGCGIVPINEKALLSTTTGQSIHLYGSGVIQPQVTVISPDFGSIWEESIIQTPNGIYGVDTFAKKIWRYSSDGFAIISDMLVQRFLNDNINLTEYDLNEIVSYKNVKTHFNNNKGDVMFTFYNGSKEWNLCYNERLQKWTTRYSWIPAYSANISNSFISTDKKRAAYYAKLDLVKNIEKGVALDTSPLLNVVENEGVKMFYNDGALFSLKGFNSSSKTVGDDIMDVEYSWIPNVKKISFQLGDDFKTFYTEGSTTKISVFEDGGYGEGIWDFSNLGSCKLGSTVHMICGKYEIIGKLKTDIDFSTVQTENTESEYAKQNCSDWFSSWVFIPKNCESSHFAIYVSNVGDKTNPLCQVIIEFDYDVYQQISTYNMMTDEETEGLKIKVYSGSIEVPFLVDSSKLKKEDAETLEEFLRIKLYTHGKAGNYSEMNMTDNDPNNQILPTMWYGRQEPFEFEFVVNAASGYQKIFDNIVIVSNNAEPDSIECTIIGDGYNFNKEGIYDSENFGGTSEDKFDLEFKNSKYSQNFDIVCSIGNQTNISFKTNILKDRVLNQYTLTSCSKLRDMSDPKYNRRLGNMTYLEDKWNITLDPIYFKNKEVVKLTDSENKTSVVNGRINTVRLRDKWMKVRIKYKGDKLAVISAIQSLFTMSFA